VFNSFLYERLPSDLCHFDTVLKRQPSDQPRRIVSRWRSKTTQSAKDCIPPATECPDRNEMKRQDVFHRLPSDFVQRSETKLYRGSGSKTKKAITIATAFHISIT
jgi:hypothetical protein